MHNLNDEDFIHIARFKRYETMDEKERQYLENRLKQLGYTIEYGCCGSNILRFNKRVENI